MTTTYEAIAVLSRALDQAGDVLGGTHADRLAAPTPCEEWDVSHLAGHLVGTPGRFAQAMRGEQPDWSAPPEPASGDWAGTFRAAADDLIHLWHQAGDGADAAQADFQTAELAVHTWDLARATGQDRPLDPEVAERALALMAGALTPDNRGNAFGPPADVPADADPYERLAGLAGRRVDWRPPQPGQQSGQQPG